MLIHSFRDTWLSSRGGGSDLRFPPRLVVVQMPPDSRLRHSTSPIVSQVFGDASSPLRGLNTWDIRVEYLRDEARR